MALLVEAWDPELFQDLQQLLTRISTQPTTSTIRRFAARLDDASPWITSLTHLPGPNEAEKQALERGKPLVERFQCLVKADFSRGCRTAGLTFWLFHQNHWTPTRPQQQYLHPSLPLTALLRDLSDSH